ncbi:MAG: UPF0182 family protein [Actinobacteria bacterium]|nr:UPF0182 family protein [Actinomycetota bacterium]
MGDAIRNRLGLIVAVVAVVVLLSANRVSAFLTDLWWFQDLGYAGVFTGILTTQIGVGVAFGAALGLLVAVNLWVTTRLRPVVLPANRREAIVERYRQMADPYVPWLIAAVSALFALSAGTAVATQWPRFLLWINGGTFGDTDLQFGRDIGFYVFDLPWWEFVQGWLFTSLLMVLLVTAGAHYLLGSIRLEVPGDRVTPQAKAHLSVLAAGVLLAHGWGYWLDRFELNFSPRGQVTGASYTDVNAELPALNLLLIVAAVAVVLLLLNIRRRGWVLPGAAIGLLVLASIVLQGIYPAAIQRLRVDPQELEREEPFIARNLEATRVAYDLADVTRQRFEVRNDFSQEDVEPNQLTLNNVRVWDPAVLETTYKQLQAIRTYYDFVDVDVDRYDLAGEQRQVMISARELAPEQLEPQAQTWQNLHLTYTHGFGDVSSRVNVATGEGQPVFLARDIPPRGEDVLVPDEPGLYFGESHADYSIVRTDQPEIDFESSETGQQQTTTYAGEGGVPVGNYLRRLAFALRFADPNLVLSGLINDESEIIFQRTIKERVGHVAPFLLLDEDAYLAVADGRLVWIQDAYTTSAYYPYSERRLFPGTQRAVNYVRNSVKAVVDAYDGTVTLYVARPDDPIVQAWRKAFPEPFADMSEASEQLISHFRYPEDMFTLQSEVFRTYHMEGAGEFYSKADAWEIPNDPAFEANQPSNAAQGVRPLDPYYLLMRLPGEENEEFVLIQPFKALNKPNMIAWLAGRSDPEHYGELFAVEFPSDQAILGPAQAQARIEQESEIAEYITLRDQRGSQVIRGNLIILPIERSILYVEPLFLENPQAQIPELDQVVLVMGDDVVMAETLEDALAELLRADEVPVEQGPDEGDDEGEEEPAEVTIDDLIADMLQAFLDAQEALQQGDLAEYQEQIDRANRLAERLAEEREVPEPGAQPSPGASPGASPGSSPAPTETASPSG